MLNHPAKYRILIVEDDENYARELSESLADEGYEVLTVNHGASALEILENQSVDLGFVDLSMPGMDGMTVIEKAAEIAPQVPLVMLTGYGTIDRAVKAVQLGAYDFIEKPASLDRILLTVSHALEKRELVQQNRRLSDEIQDKYAMIGTSSSMQNIYRLIDHVAPTNVSVLITGETGTGKELVARAIHLQSNRNTGPFIKINCASIPDSLFESELFGHEKGAFTGAVQKKPGKFQLADSGTLFLDEIGDMSPAAQAKILRALETQQIETVGGLNPEKVDVRVLAATNQDLGALTNTGRFREDLFYRLNHVGIQMPALRDRKEDIPDLLAHFIQHFREEHNRKIMGFESKAIQLILNWDWPGNVRELRAFVEKMVILSVDEWITMDEISQLYRAKTNGQSRLVYRAAMDAYESDFLQQALVAHEWNVAETAFALGLDRTNLYKKMQRLGIQKKVI